MYCRKVLGPSCNVVKVLGPNGIEDKSEEHIR